MTPEEFTEQIKSLMNDLAAEYPSSEEFVAAIAEDQDEFIRASVYLSSSAILNVLLLLRRNNHRNHEALDAAFQHLLNDVGMLANAWFGDLNAKIEAAPIKDQVRGLEYNLLCAGDNLQFATVILEQLKAADDVLTMPERKAIARALEDVIPPMDGYLNCVRRGV